MNNSMLVGSIIGAIAVTALGSVAGYKYLDQEPQYAEVVSSKAVDKPNPAHIHGRRLPVLSLAHPNPILATLAAIAPRNAAIANISRAPLPAMSVARSGSKIVRNGI